VSADYFKQRYSVLQCTVDSTEGLLVTQYGYIYIVIEDIAVAEIGIPQHL